ncbi:MAG TPA: TetR/AcrR family transcriptional regulator [Solirubrobacteraceae bacterium]|nr:TetR/AcrR family transcriptional regulator [Solirubrobacteraceae bacterium]
MSPSDDTKTRMPAVGKRGDGAGLKKRQREIIDAAAEIFYRKGYSETSVQDVADAVGILKGSLYYYIDSKEDLLFQMLLEVHEDAKSVVTETASLEIPPLDRLRRYIQRHVEYNARNLAKIAVYYHDFGLLSPERRKAIVGQRNFYEDFVQGLIREAQQRDEVDPSVDPLLISNAIFGVANWLYTWYRPDGSATPEYLGKLYAEVIVEGVTAGNMPKPPPATPAPASKRRRRG